MRIHISHNTRYSYADAPKSAIQILRVTPRSFDAQFVKSWRIDIDADCKRIKDEDAYGNITHTYFINQPMQEMNIHVEGVIETMDTGGLIGGAMERFPPLFWLRHTALTKPNLSIETMARSVSIQENGDSLASLHAILMWIHQNIKFVIGSTTTTTSASQAFEAKAGVCQDLAQVFIAAARSLNIPARYVAGYYLRTDTVEQEAGHAWAEAYVPDIGWTGFDPANGVCVDGRYIRVAIGIDALDAAPIRGMYTGGSDEALDVAVTVAAS